MMTDNASISSTDDPLSKMEIDVKQQYNKGLTPLAPRQKTLFRISMLIWAVIIMAIAAGLFIASKEIPIAISASTIFGPAGVIALLLIILVPHRKYRRWGYDLGAEQLRVLRGYLWRIDTIVPFNRIQHIDVAQGPLQRAFGLSTLVVHTAGTHNSIVILPGLHTADAEAMRETIKGHIRKDMI